MSRTKHYRIGMAIGELLGFFLVVWLCWLAYTWVMPQVFPQGPVNLINPGFWLFFVVIWMIKFIINILTPDK